MTGRSAKFQPPPPTDPQPPNVNVYLSLGIMGVVGALVIYQLNPRGFPGGLLGFIFTIGCIGGAFALLLAAATHRYTRGLESNRFRQRAGASDVVPYNHIVLQDGTIYNIEGTLSMRTNDGGWMDVGEGAGTFQIVPRRASRPSLMDPTHGHPFNRKQGETDADIIARAEADGYTQVERAEYERFQRTKPKNVATLSYNPRPGAALLYFVKIITPELPEMQTPPTREG